MVVSAPVLELEADVLERMRDYVAQVAAGFERITRHYWAGVYLHGLMLDGERKSIQPLAERVTVPGWHGDTMQALQHFISDSTWDEQAVLQVYRRLLAAAFADPSGVIVIDDTGFAKKGRYSVGVARQYSGTLGKTDNCQVAVSLHYAAPKGDYPLALRLFLPESWTSQSDRMDAARVPLEHQASRTKNQIALELLDQVHTEGLPYRAVVADAGYGLSVDFRRGLDERGVVYVVGIAGNEAVLTELPTWSVKAEVEGRAWPGFHHHAALCFLAYGFLALERARGTATALDDLDETDSPFAVRHPVSPPALVRVD